MKNNLKYFLSFLLSVVIAQEIDDIKTTIIVDGLNRPVFAAFEPKTNQMYAVEQTGKIYLIHNSDQKVLFLDCDNILWCGIMIMYIKNIFYKKSYHLLNFNQYLIRKYYFDKF